MLRRSQHTVRQKLGSGWQRSVIRLHGAQVHVVHHALLSMCLSWLDMVAKADWLVMRRKEIGRAVEIASPACMTQVSERICLHTQRHHPCLLLTQRMHKADAGQLPSEKRQS